MNNQLLLLLLFILMVIMINNQCLGVRNIMEIRNIEDIRNSDQYTRFGNFYIVNIDENHLNDLNECNGNCTKISDTHDNYNRLKIDKYNRCIGDIVLCKVKRPHSKFHNCNICSCVCKVKQLSTVKRDNDQLINSICLDPILSNIKHKYVMIGVRFKRINNTVILQAKFGKLRDDNSSILPGTIYWSSPPERCYNTAEIGYNNTFFHLDNILFENGSIVTGVAVEKYNVQTSNSNDRQFFRLAVYGAPVDIIENGVNDGVIRKINTVGTDERLDLTNDNMIPSTYARKLNRQLSESGKHTVKFRTTNINNVKFTGKYIIPYLDTRIVDTKLPVPLAGIGINYIGTDNAGGYLSLVIFAYKI